MRRYPAIALFSLTLCIFILFLLFPSVTQVAAQEGLLFCGKVLIPSLFPGFVVSNLLIALSPFYGGRKKSLFSRLFRLPTCAVECFWIGLLAGFPSAAEDTVKFYCRKGLTKNEAERCLAFTNNPGIIFVLCAVGGGMLGSLKAGVLLWISQTLSACLVGILIADPKDKQSLPAESPDTKQSLLRSVFPLSVTNAVRAALNICGFVLFFRVVIAVLTTSVFAGAHPGVLAGLLEMTCGLSSLSAKGSETIPFAAVILAWSGFSVHFQILNVLASTDLSLKRYFPGKLLHALISPFFAVALTPLLLPDQAPGGKSVTLATVGAVLIIVFVVFYRSRKEYLHGNRNFQRRTGTAGTSRDLY